MRVLVLRSGAVGDVILTFPLVQACMDRYGAAAVALAAPARMHALAHACGIANCIDVDAARIHRLFADELTGLPEAVRGYDLILNLLTGPDSQVHANLAAAGRTVHSLAPPHDGIGMHAVEYLCSVLPAPEVQPRQARFDPVLSASRYDLPRMGNKPRIIIHPGSGSSRKLIDTALFEALVARAASESEVILLAGPADAAQFEFGSAMAERHGCGNVRDIPLIDVAHLIDSADRYVGLDSGISHLAALTRARCTVIFSVTDPAVWRPYGDNVEVIRPSQISRLD